MSAVLASTEGRKPLPTQKDHTMTTEFTHPLCVRTLRTLRRRIERSGYSQEQADYGIAWACERGFEGTEWGYRLAMSRILYSDDELAEGIRIDGGR